MLIFSVCVFPAVTEEIAFRGLVQHWLHVAVQPRQAIVYAAALFTALHFSILSAPTLFLAGCLLGWLRWRTGSLWPPIVVHFLHNLAVVTFFDG
jgi:membrane protease YdiL (CAAX protease family)